MNSKPANYIGTGYFTLFPNNVDAYFNKCRYCTQQSVLCKEASDGSEYANCQVPPLKILPRSATGLGLLKS